MLNNNFKSIPSNTNSSLNQSMNIPSLYPSSSSLSESSTDSSGNGFAVKDSSVNSSFTMDNYKNNVRTPHSNVWGISLAGLLTLSDMFTDLGQTMLNLRYEIVSKTVPVLSPLIDLLPSSSLFRGKADYFVSYDSRIRFCDFLSAIMDFDDANRNNNDPNREHAPTYYYVELFVHSQHIIKGPDYWIQYLTTHTTNIGRTLVVLDDLVFPCLCYNAWCALEISSTYGCTGYLSSVDNPVEVIFPRRVREQIFRTRSSSSRASPFLVDADATTTGAPSPSFPSSVPFWNLTETGAYHAACKELQILCTVEKRGQGKALRDICTVTTQRIHSLIDQLTGFLSLNDRFNEAIRTAIDRTLNEGLTHNFLLSFNPSLYDIENITAKSRTTTSGTYPDRTVPVARTAPEEGLPVSVNEENSSEIPYALPDRLTEMDFLTNFKFDTVNYPGDDTIDKDYDYSTTNDHEKDEFIFPYESFHRRLDNLRSSPKLVKSTKLSTVFLTRNNSYGSSTASSSTPSSVRSTSPKKLRSPKNQKSLPLSPESTPMNSDNSKTQIFVPKDRNNVKFSTYRYHQNKVKEFISIV